MRLLIAIMLVSVLAVMGGAMVSANSIPQPILYGVNSVDDGLSKIDPVSGAVTFIGKLNPDPNKYTTPIAMAVRPSDGKIFVWTNSDPPYVLLTVDPSTGLATPVDALALPQQELASLAFAPNGTLYGVNWDLFTINTSTGVLTKVGSLGGRTVYAADFNAV